MLGSWRSGTAAERAALAALLAVVWLVYAPLLAGEFVYDDKVVVLQNPLLTSWTHLPQVFSSGMWDFADADTARSTAYWRPLSSLLLMLLMLLMHLQEFLPTW